MSAGTWLLLGYLCSGPVSWAVEDHYTVCKCFPVKAIPAVAIVVEQVPKKVKI